MLKNNRQEKEAKYDVIGSTDKPDIIIDCNHNWTERNNPIW